MKKPVAWIFMLIVLSGCHQTKLQDASNHSGSNQTAFPVGVATAIDEWRRERAGIAGALPIDIKKETLVRLVGNYLIDYIHKETGLRVERIEIAELDSIKLAVTRNKVNGIIVLKIKTLEISFLIESQKSLQADAALELIVFDENGVEIYRRTVKEHYKKQTRFPVSEQSVSELVESVVKNTLKQYLKDPDLKKVIARFKYGPIGGFITRIF